MKVRSVFKVRAHYFPVFLWLTVIRRSASDEYASDALIGQKPINQEVGESCVDIVAFLCNCFPVQPIPTALVVQLNSKFI